MEAKPKYRITSTPEGGGLPEAQRFCQRKGDLIVACKSMQAASPKSVVEVRMQIGLRHGYPMRWRWDGQALQPTSYYDQLAIGSRPLTARQLADLRKES
jgi:hypothetical protein